MSNDEITREEETTEARTERMSETVTKTVEGLVDVGKLWAAHGLSVGRSSLETTAATLRKTAGLLGELSERFAAQADKSRDAA